ncbi:MAG TPA: pantetheine-phosphate adenylyltransferase [Dehalococcoidales bacterium]|nr:pantetheine-phosphate adenylyltransferase [Dehalococcoidales bacterium]
MTVAIYPGSFDPITNGHLDIVTRAARLFEKVIIGVYERPNKNLLFTVEERVDLARRTVANLANVEVKSFSGLSIAFAKQVKAQAMIRGLRMSADFEREFEMAMMNRKLFPGLDMVCLMASQEYQFLSSSLLKEVACLEGNINDLVPEHVAKALRKKVHSEM